MDTSERDIRKVVDPLLPSVLLSEIATAKEHYEQFAHGNQRVAKTFGKRFRVLIGFSYPELWVDEGVSQIGTRRGRRFEGRGTAVILAARILLEKGLLEIMVKRNPFDYKRFHHFAEKIDHYQSIWGEGVWCLFVSSHDPKEKKQARLFVDFVSQIARETQSTTASHEWPETQYARASQRGG